MSLYTHRCECGHLAYEHDEGVCKFIRHCPCKIPSYGPSELVPTFDKNGQRVDRVIEPGDGIRSQERIIGLDENTGAYIMGRPGSIIIPSCNCGECQQAYGGVA